MQLVYIARQLIYTAEHRLYLIAAKFASSISPCVKYNKMDSKESTNFSCLACESMYTKKYYRRSNV